MRPTSILYFERLSLLSIFAGIAFAIVAWQDGLATVERVNGFGPAFMPLLQLCGLALLLILIFLISRRASVVAKWIFAGLFLFGAVAIAPQLPAELGRGLIGLLLLTQLAIQAAAIYFLFSPESRDWFGERRLRSGPTG
jgi:hypothetical protein